MIRFAKSLLVVSALALAAGCSGGGAPNPNSLGGPDCPTSGPYPSIVPVSCAPSQGATSDPSYRPADTAAIPAQTLPAETGQLTAGGNNTNPSVATETFHVVLPKGTRLQVHAVCAGLGHISVTTVPVSDAEMEFACGFDNYGADVAVADEHFVTEPTPYAITVVTHPPARWYVVITGITTAPPPPV